MLERDTNVELVKQIYTLVANNGKGIIAVMSYSEECRAKERRMSIAEKCQNARLLAEFKNKSKRKKGKWFDHKS